MYIDSHQHFWKYHPVKDAWISEEMKVLQRDFLPEDLWHVLKGNSMDGCVAVQADQSENETRFLLELAGKNSFVKGVVGWVDLRAPDLEEKLQRFKQYPLLKGFRHIVQAEPEGFLLLPEFISGVKKLHDHHFTYDVLVYHHQLKDVVRFVEKLPAQKLVMDHCAKPDIKNKNLGDWEKMIREIAQAPNVYCKLSGLFTEADWKGWKKKDFYPYLDVVFDAFGPERLLFGSDWPVLLLAGNYQQWKELVEKYLDKFSEAERTAVMGGNAVSFYQL